MNFLNTHPTKNGTDVYGVLFRIGMTWRIIYGFLRLILGFVLLRLIGTPLSDLFYAIMKHELVEDPSDSLVQTINSFLQHQPFTVTYFLAAYVMTWGIIDIILSMNLLDEKLWAFPVSMYLIGAFVLYEIYRLSHTHSLILAGVIVVDVFLIWLIRKEYYKQLRRKNHTAPPASAEINK